MSPADKTIQVLLVGVGGQGVLTATKMLGNATHAAGLDLSIGQLHGMSQRGGSVQCTVKIGRAASSYIIGDAADIVVAFEPLELIRALPLIDKKTRVVANSGTIMPHLLVQRGAPYPSLSRLFGDIRAAAAELVVIDGPTLIDEVGVKRTLNVLMLGALASLAALPLGEELWRSIEKKSPARFVEANRRAFCLGRDQAKSHSLPAVGATNERTIGVENENG